jgi:4-hydroxy-tetrahydrodipicolinate synthase
MFKGTYTAVITPFKDDSTLDIEGWQQNIQYQIDHNIDGLIILGTTGETPTLTSQEQEILIKESAQKDIQTIVGTGSNSTEQTIKNTQRAQDLGADGALVVTPYYNKPTQEGIYLHFKTICDNTDIPIIVYNIKGRCGQNINTSTLQRIADLPNIKAVKEASGDIVQVMNVIKTIPHINVLSGDDVLTLPIMALGGHGIVSVASNIIPAQIKNLVETQSKELHYHLLPLLQALFLETNPMPVKAAMNLCNMPAGPCRLPLCNMQDSTHDQLKRVLQNMGLL